MNKLPKTYKRLEERLALREAQLQDYRRLASQPLNFHPDSNPDYIQGYKDAIRLFEDVCLGDLEYADKVKGDL